MRQSNDGLTEQVAALSASGLSVRGIAEQLGVDRSKVHRILQKSQAAGVVPAAAAAAALVDPIVSLLTRAERLELGLSPVDAPNALQRYRILMFRSSAAGDAARSLFDHGRGGEPWLAWMAAGGPAEFDEVDVDEDEAFWTRRPGGHVVPRGRSGRSEVW